MIFQNKVLQEPVNFTIIIKNNKIKSKYIIMNYSLCPYKLIFGSPGEGVHQYRILNIAVFDVLSVLIVAHFISEYTKSDFWYTLIILFLIGIIVHRLFCVRTTVDKLLFK